jgi:hypothetical protein
MAFFERDLPKHTVAAWNAATTSSGMPRQKNFVGITTGI